MNLTSARVNLNINSAYQWRSEVLFIDIKLSKNCGCSLQLVWVKQVMNSLVSWFLLLRLLLLPLLCSTATTMTYFVASARSWNSRGTCHLRSFGQKASYTAWWPLNLCWIVVAWIIWSKWFNSTQIIWFLEPNIDSPRLCSCFTNTTVLMNHQFDATRF